MSARRWCLGILLAAVIGPAWPDAAFAQRPPPRQRGVRTTVDERTARAEYATVLLQTGRHAEAAREFRALLATDSTNAEWRLGLARALAWGGHGREAEGEVLRLMRSDRDNAILEELLRVARGAIATPTVDQASRWVSEDPGWLAYRLALARSLVREGRAAAALSHLDTIVARAPTVAHLREAASVAAMAGQPAVTASFLARALRLSSGDATLRRELARALAAAENYESALAHYDTLLESAREPELLFERGQVLAWSGALRRAEGDLEAAVAARPVAEWYVLLGDVRRWRGDWRRSRGAYARAEALSPGNAAAAAGLAALEREERQAVATSDLGAQEGWRSRSRWTEDNAGFLLLATQLGFGAPVGGGSVIGFAVEQRRTSHRSHRDATPWVSGWTAEAELTHAFDAFTLDLRVGIARHALTGESPVAHLGASAWLAPVRLAVSVTREPLYGRLMSMRALVDWAEGEHVGGAPLEGQTIAAEAAIPVGAAQLWLAVERLAMSDGNERRSASAGARYPLARDWTLLYSGGQLGFDERSDLYWDPRRHTTHALGVEYAWGAGERLTGIARAMPGLGWSTEAITLSADSVLAVRSRRTPQLALTSDLRWRAAPWEVTMQVGYGRGRADGYQSLQGILQLRLDWPASRREIVRDVAGDHP